MMAGPVEVGSFTLAPRKGNPGTVLWRDVNGRTTMNRVGLKNPGAAAAAAFLSLHRVAGTYGVSIATTPEVDAVDEQAAHVAQAIGCFIDLGVRPDWFTVNLSCPNTEQDPSANQTETLAAAVCSAAVERAGTVPVWVKIGPDLGDQQYDALLRVFEETGVRAVVATNTLPVVVPNTDIRAGAGGKRLFERALSVVLRLYAMRERRSYSVDIVGCGGVMDGADLRAYLDAGALAVQIWSALVFRGPFAPEDITREYLAMLQEGQS
jgi:dihydroorotate dehydrogenase